MQQEILLKQCTTVLLLRLRRINIKTNTGNIRRIFKRNVLSDVNGRVSLNNYSFTIRSGSKASLETDLTISENEINIENKGKGKQCFIKTDFALKKKIKNRDLDVVLIEEPENHLSHINMKKLIRRISESENRQLFVATHNDLISTRLDLRKSILLNSGSSAPVLLSGLPDTQLNFLLKHLTIMFLNLFCQKR